MRAVFFYGLGSSHFLRGVTTELRDREWDIAVSDSRQPPPFDQLLSGADLVLVDDGVASDIRHEVGEHRIRNPRYRLLFRAARQWDSGDLAGGDLAGYDGVLAASDAIRDSYLRAGWSRTSWTWHEAADTTLFHPLSRTRCAGDLVWIGDWAELQPVSGLFEFLLDPAADLKLKVSLYGAEYPEAVQAVLRERDVECAGPLATEHIPGVLAAFRAIVHIPPLTHPATRVIEALACGIPLVSAPWDDADHLFRPPHDYLVANTGEEMREQLRLVMEDARLCADLSLHGLQTILSRHTCAHRVDELISIFDQLTAAGEYNYALMQ